MLVSGFGMLALVPAAAAKRPRPPDVPPLDAIAQVAPNGFQLYNDYATPERTFSSVHLVIHYEGFGIDAPPLNDDDNDEVPDYVERVADAADGALAYLERRGFPPVMPDTGGPDGRPDIYISRFMPGYFGVAFPASRAEGGAFVVVSNGLDPSGERSLGSVYGTVAHELFHLIQFSYFAPTVDPPLPDWVLEGSATAMERRVLPYLDDLVWALNIRSWLQDPSRSFLTDAQAASLLWYRLDRLRPRLLGSYLSRLRSPFSDDGAQELVRLFERQSDGSFADAFTRLAADTAGDFLARLRAVGTLRRGGHFTGAMRPLALRIVRLRLPGRGARTVAVERHDQRLRAVVVYALEAERAGYPPTIRELPGRSSRHGTRICFRIPDALRADPRLRLPTLVLANANPAGTVSYSVRAD